MQQLIVYCKSFINTQTTTSYPKGPIINYLYHGFMYDCSMDSICTLKNILYRIYFFTQKILVNFKNN